MKKPTLISCVFVMVCLAQSVKGQNSVNEVNLISQDEIASHAAVNGIVFTPQGILRTSKSGGTKSLKVEARPVVVKSKPVPEVKDIIETLSPLQYKYAMIMDVDMESLKNTTLLSFIEDWFGTPYLLGGSSKKGIDCSALTGSLLLAVYGSAVPRTARQQYKATKHIKKKDLEEGDLVFFNTHGGVSHVGLYLDNDYFVHASSSQGVMISSLNSRYFAKRFICGGRMEGEDVSSKTLVASRK